MGLPNVTSLALGRLDRTQAETLVERVAGGRKFPAEVMAQIVAKTDGVPLFVEELTKTVQESGLLVEEGDRYRLDGPLPPLAIPATLQDSLMARLDRLAPVKEIAQIGAAVGREFSYALLREVAGRDDAALQSALAQLEDAELLFRTGAPLDARYTFKHALVQDTAYESLLKSRRQVLHRRIAETLRDKFPAVAAAEPELVAHHFTQAALDEPAIEWWGKAGDQALRRSAFKEAIAHLGKAIEMTDKAAAMPPQGGERLRLQIGYGNALIATRGYGAAETTAAFARARDLAAGIADAPERFSVYYGLWVGIFTRGELAALLEIDQAILRDVEARPDSADAVIAHRLNGMTNWFTGNFDQARVHLEKALAKIRSEPGSRPRLQCRSRCRRGGDGLFGVGAMAARRGRSRTPVRRGDDGASPAERARFDARLCTNAQRRIRDLAPEPRGSRARCRVLRRPRARARDAKLDHLQQLPCAMDALACGRWSGRSRGNAQRHRHLPRAGNRPLSPVHGDDAGRSGSGGGRPRRRARKRGTRDCGDGADRTALLRSRDLPRPRRDPAEARSGESKARRRILPHRHRHRAAAEGAELRAARGAGSRQSLSGDGSQRRRPCRARACD